MMRKEISLSQALDFINSVDEKHVVELSNPCFSGTLAFQEVGEVIEMVMMFKIEETEKYVQLRMKRALFEEMN